MTRYEARLPQETTVYDECRLKRSIWQQINRTCDLHRDQTSRFAHSCFPGWLTTRFGFDRRTSRNRVKLALSSTGTIQSSAQPSWHRINTWFTMRTSSSRPRYRKDFPNLMMWQMTSWLRPSNSAASILWPMQHKVGLSSQPNASCPKSSRRCTRMLRSFLRALGTKSCTRATIRSGKLRHSLRQEKIWMMKPWLIW